MPPAEALARRFFDAIEAEDIETAGTLHAPTLRVWHSNDGRETGRDANLALLDSLVAQTASRRCLERRLDTTSDRFVHQHRLLATAGDGAVLDAPICLVAKVGDGLIERIDEYVDARAVEAWLRTP